MAEEVVSTPGMTAEGPVSCATPESWEMRSEAQTPAQQLQSITTNDQKMTTPSSRDYGISDSLNDFMDFAMYETPPGAHLYRDQFDYDIYDMSPLDNPGLTESSPHDTSCNKITCGLDVMREGSPIEGDMEGDIATKKETAEDNPSIAGCSPPRSHDMSCDSITSGLDPMSEGSLPEGDKEGDLAMTKEITEQNHDEFAICAEVENNQHAIEESNEKHTKIGVSDLQSSFGTTETACQQKEVEECILERLDQQKYPQEEQLVQGQIAPVIEPAFCHDLLSPVGESVQDVSTCRMVTSQTVLDDPTTEEVCHVSEEEPKQFADCMNSSQTGNEPWKEDEKDEYPGETEFQIQTLSPSPLPSENMNSSLMSMGAPHDAHELNQLADFLSMEDPFKKPVEGTSPSRELDYEEPRSVPVADDKISSLPTPPKKKKKGRKVYAANERRRSVRIARRESLLNAPGDTQSHVEISNMVSGYDENDTDAPVTIDPGQERMDQVREAGNVPHLFPEVEESRATMYCDEIKTVQLGQMGLSTPMTPNDAETFEHLNIDLPMSRKKKVTKNVRRRSVRLLKQDMQVDVVKSVSPSKPTIQGQNMICDSSLLADFADFRLSDSWMPGESQVTKTHKEKSGRRKSARLSGVPIQLLELADKSEVKTYGEVEEVSISNRPIADYQIEDSDMTDIASTVTAETSVKRDPACEKTESLIELPVERQDAVQPSEKKKATRTKRRRSVRLVQKPHEQPNSNLDSQEQKDLPSKKAAVGYQKGKPELGHDNVLQEVKFTSCDNVSIERQRKEEDFTILKSHVRNPPMDLESADVMDLQESICKASSRISKDTPLTGRKRVSRISQKDKEDDDAQEHPRVNTHVESKQKKSTGTKKTDDSKTEVSAQQHHAEDGRAEESVSDNFQVTNKIKLMYMKKGGPLKKHNLETIFESPKIRATGSPVNILGGRKMKRIVNFTETPWLGRTGRTKGRKIKKGKQVKRILSSKVEKSWKLDVRLSSLDDPSS